jgi:hypothetical protein
MQTQTVKGSSQWRRPYGELKTEARLKTNSNSKETEKDKNC